LSRKSFGLTGREQLNETNDVAVARSSNWLALAVLIAMVGASCFAHHHLVALGTSFLTFSAFAITPALLQNLQGPVADPAEAKPLISVVGARKAVALAVKIARGGRRLAWALFVSGVAVVTVGILVAKNTLDTRLSGLVLAIGFTMCFLAYTSLAFLRMGYTFVEGKRQDDVAELLGTARTAAWVGSAAFALGSILVFADAMIR
jgi:hypothetical protein